MRAPPRGLLQRLHRPATPGKTVEMSVPVECWRGGAERLEVRSMADLVIRGATLCDGTGREAVRGDLAVESDRIIALGRVPERGTTEVDGTGLVLAPGFIDLHTHYDCQLFWDPFATPSPWHGVTTVVTGNCGFTIAPCRSADRETLMQLLLFVEGMPLETLRAGIRWTWEDFAGYLDALERLGPGVNVVPFVGHSAVRFRVMGRAAVERAATPEERARMAALVREALAAGAIGWSTSLSPTRPSTSRTIPSGGRSWRSRATSGGGSSPTRASAASWRAVRSSRGSRRAGTGWCAGCRRASGRGPGRTGASPRSRRCAAWRRSTPSATSSSSTPPAWRHARPRWCTTCRAASAASSRAPTASSGSSSTACPWSSAACKPVGALAGCSAAGAEQASDDANRCRGQGRDRPDHQRALLDGAAHADGGQHQRARRRPGLRLDHAEPAVQGGAHA